MRRWIYLILLPGFITINGIVPLYGQSQGEAGTVDTDPDSLLRTVIRANADPLFNGDWFLQATGYQRKDSIRLDTVVIDRKKKVIRIVAGDRLSWAPVREGTVDSLERGMRAGCAEQWAGYRVEIYSAGRNIREYIPNYYRSDKRSLDRERMVRSRRNASEPLVKDLSRSYLQEADLYNTHIALWHSHGWYYEPSLHRWEWQRARLYGTVEDLFPMTFTLQFLVPMLENAGATVLLPRERDFQVEEVIVDNDGSRGRSIYLSEFPSGRDSAGTGFAIGHPPYTGENPFTLGTYEEMETDRIQTGSMQWIPDIPAAGEYGVYVSYHASDNNADDAQYTVYHAGGSTSFSVNQQMGGGTWIYLGRFRFNKGIDPGKGRVELTNQSRRRRKKVSGDAVRFGGGMGIIERNGMTSLRPRYQEAARYYLQFAGFPDSVVWKLNIPDSDYRDDYQSRGEWVSYLIGDPDNGEKPGLGIPVDLAFAFHTDAGITDNDTVIGTLVIFNTSQRKSPFPNELSRMASRDLADLVQTQIIEDLRALYDPAWTRREMWDKPYSEAVRSNAPTMLLELLSHQNLLDMRFGQEPEFRFYASRAIYKGILRYLSFLKGTEVIVQPLPVDHFRTSLPGDTLVRLDWQPVADPLEPTACPDSYRVYTRVNEGGYDHGVDVSQPWYVLEDPFPDSIYSFRITAFNRGGESFPSEELSVCIRSGSPGKILVINAFDRTGGPAWFDDTAHSGFLPPPADQGVPWGVDLHTVGHQFDFDKSSPWLDDDSPGHGASSADLEGLVIPGNSFNFSYIHGQSIASSGYSFLSVSDESVTDDTVALEGYLAVDYLAGEELTSAMPKNDSVARFRVFEDPMFPLLKDYLDSGGSLLITGAHIASDIHINKQDSVAAGLLGFKWRTSRASRTGVFYFMDTAFAPYTQNFIFNTGYDSVLYTVEGADALEPARKSAITLARYRENNMSAAVLYHNGKGTVLSVGFPFETIRSRGDRDLIMRKVLEILFESSVNE